MNALLPALPGLTTGSPGPGTEAFSMPERRCVREREKTQWLDAAIAHRSADDHLVLKREQARR